MKTNWEKKNPARSLIVVAGVISILLLAGCSVLRPSYTAAVATVTAEAQAPATTTPPAAETAPSPQVLLPTTIPVGGTQPRPAAPTGNLETDVAAVAQRVRPAVVFVGIEQSLQSFSQPIPVGNGSGAIIDSQGHILTNNHVVEAAQALKVTLPDGRTFDGTVMGRDPATDLAVIQIKGDNLPTIPLGDSSTLQIGEWVVAIGNALGLEGGPTVTTGVVSAVNRTIEEENGASIAGLIQTDAAINPGNSGGPLVNLRGELIGINTAVPGATQQGVQPSGIGFAIAINEAKPIIQQLIAQGRVVRPYLGVVPVTITPAILTQVNVSVTEGVIITSVSANSPAAKAGLQPGDVTVAADGKTITEEIQLRQAIQAHKIGDTITLTIVRGAQQLNVQVQLAEAPTP